MAPLIRQGSFQSIKSCLPVIEFEESFKDIDFQESDHEGPRANTEFADSIMSPPRSMSDYFPKSSTLWGLSLQSMKVTREIGGLFTEWFHKGYKVYYLAWSWDLSADKPSIYPGEFAPADKCLIPLDKDVLKLFLGQGTSLWPLRRVIAGLNVRIMLWNCKQGARDFGESMVSVHKAIDESDLLKEIDNLNAAAGPIGVICDAIEAAANALVGVVGGILASRRDDYIDLYEGNYAVSEPWVPGPENHAGRATTISLNRLSAEIPSSPIE